MAAVSKPIALVTGASRGIGRSIALRLAQDGFKVVINYRVSRTEAEEVQRSIAAMSGEAVICGFDVADKAAVYSEIKRLSKELGRIEVLINNAGVVRDQPLVRMYDEDWDLVMRTNLNSSYWCTKAVLKTWVGKNHGSRIINISSVCGETGNAYQANYAASKAGLIGFTKAMARELAGKGITVNAVAPGFIETDFTKHLPTDDLTRGIPLGRFGTPDEVAHVVSMLASPLASYITGEVVRVNGGMLM